MRDVRNRTKATPDTTSDDGGSSGSRRGLHPSMPAFAAAIDDQEIAEVRRMMADHAQGDSAERLLEIQMHNAMEQLHAARERLVRSRRRVAELERAVGQLDAFLAMARGRGAISA